MDALGPIVAGLRLYIFVLFIALISKCDPQEGVHLAGEHFYDRRISTMYTTEEDEGEEDQEDAQEDEGEGHSTATIEKANQNSVAVAGRTEKCANHVHVSMDDRAPGPGVASPNRITLNPSILGQFAPKVQLFIFYHECGHHHVGGNEVKSDCWAVHRAVREKWLDEETITGVCRSFGPGNRPSPNGHPGAQDRCRLVRSCYQQALAKYGPLQPPVQVARPQDTQPQPPQRQIATVPPRDPGLPAHMRPFTFGVR